MNIVLSLMLNLAVLVGLVICPGCTMDADTAKADSRYKNTDGKDKTKKAETNSQNSREEKNRDYELSITPTPGSISVDLPEIPDSPYNKPPVRRTETAPASIVSENKGKDGGKDVKPAENRNMQVPGMGQTVWFGMGEDQLGIPYYPWQQIHYKSSNHQTNENQSHNTFTLSEEFVHTAVRNIPSAVWVGAGFFLLIAIFVAVFAKGYRLFSIPIVIFTAFLLVMVILTYNQSEVLAYGVVGSCLFFGLIGMGLLFWYIRSRNFHQQGFLQTVNALNVFRVEQDAEVGTNLVKTLKAGQDEHVQNYIQKQLK